MKDIIKYGNKVCEQLTNDKIVDINLGNIVIRVFKMHIKVRI